MRIAQEARTHFLGTPDMIFSNLENLFFQMILHYKKFSKPRREAANLRSAPAADILATPLAVWYDNDFGPQLRISAL